MSGEVAPRRVLFFGDSLVAGVGDPAGGGWVARVVAACFARGAGVTAYNLGVRRETSVEVAARLREEATPRVPPGADAQIVVSFGANDTTIEDGTVRVPADGSRRALATLLDEAATLGLAVLVVGPAPVAEAEQNARIRELTDVFAAVCTEHGTRFIDVVGPLLESAVWMSEVAAGDGAHPGAGGYDAIARLLIDAGLPAWLARGPAPPGPAGSSRWSPSGGSRGVASREPRSTPEQPYS